MTNRSRKRRSIPFGPSRRQSNGSSVVVVRRRQVPICGVPVNYCNVKSLDLIKRSLDSQLKLQKKDYEILCGLRRSTLRVPVFPLW